MKKIRLRQAYLLGLISLMGGLIACQSQKESSEYKFEVSPVDITVTPTDGVHQISGSSAFQLDGYFVWGGSVLKGDGGKYYMVYSAFGTGRYPFTDAWILGSQLGLAVSDRPDGNFKQLGFFLNNDGYAIDSSAWDAQMVHNPHLCRFGNKYYLYYIGASDPGNALVRSSTDTLRRRDRVQQCIKIGLITFDSFSDLLDHKFTRLEQPLLAPRTRVSPYDVVNPSPEGTVALPDNLIVCNPSVVYRPSDKKYLLYFKGNHYTPQWTGIYGVAIGDRPEGPFVAQDKPVFRLKDVKGKQSIEDCYVWYNHRDQLFYAIFKDFNGNYTKQNKPGIAIMYSKDGMDWHLPKDPLFMNKELKLKSGETISVSRLERPQLLLDENDDPIAFYAACSVETPLNTRVDGGSFNVQIKLKSTKVNE